jgi:hypothetical protein
VSTGCAAATTLLPFCFHQGSVSRHVTRPVSSAGLYLPSESCSNTLSRNLQHTQPHSSNLSVL